MDKITALVVSQQGLLRRGIEHALSKTGRIQVIGSSGMGEEALFDIDTAPPDVAIVDVGGVDEYGMTLARRIRQRSPNIGVILLVSAPSDEDLFLALRVQAAACLGMETTPEELRDTVERVARGEHPINETMAARPGVAAKVLSQFQKLSWHGEGEDVMTPLTPREIEVLGHVAEGCLNKQIALELAVSEQTIKNHITAILRKLNANARTEAVVLAIKQGLISIA